MGLYFDRCIIRLVVKVASTWANHISGSEGQNGGSLTETVGMVEPVAAAGFGVASVASPVAGSESVIVRVRVTNVG